MRPRPAFLVLVACLAVVPIGAPRAQRAGDTVTLKAPVETVIAAGDIAACRSAYDEATARLVDTMAGTILTLGDHAYPAGRARDFADCYDPSWGRLRARTRPTPGNHEYMTADAVPYFLYFGDAAGEPGRGWYSFDLGAWHVVALNSNCRDVGGCGPRSPQLQWLVADLATTRQPCVLAYWHHPRFSSDAQHGGEEDVQPFWEALVAAGADLVLNGHAHVYERFAPQDAEGRGTPRGIRQFTVGTGGKSPLYRWGRTAGNSQARSNTAFGVLKLSLGADGYAWDFVPAAGSRFTDRGTGTCH